MKVLTVDLRTENKFCIKAGLVLLLAIVCFSSGTVLAQSLVQAEYFWDTDPGLGNGTALAATDANFNETLEEILANGIGIASPGPHRFGVRVNSMADGWGSVFTTVINVESPSTTVIPEILAAEYFWDTDPGPGNGTSMIAFDGNFGEAMESLVANGLGLVSSGPHRIGVRVNSASQGWGPVFTTVIAVTDTMTISLPAVLAMEYFWDVDPGPGSGTPMLAFDGNFGEAMEAAVSNGLGLIASGPHRIGVRVNSTTQGWGPVFNTVVAITDTMTTSLPAVLAMEYFWDVDPGPGSGTPMLAFDGNFDEALEVAFSNGLGLVPSGPHRIGVRVNSATQGWGPVFNTVVAVTDTMITSVPAVLAAEYFWDADPGLGNGVSMLAFDGNYDEAFEEFMVNGLGSIAIGAHTFNARFRDSLNNWGSVFTTVVVVQDTQFSDQAILTHAEAFFDNDPGPGNGIPIAAQDGNFDEAWEYLSDTLSASSLLPGPHLLSVRVQDEAQIWGPVFSIVLRVDSSLFPITSAINGPSQFTCSQSLNGVAYTTPATTGSSYTWTVVGGTIVSGQGSPNITVNWSGPAPHQISVQGCNSNGCGNDFAMSVTIPSSLNAILVANGQTTVCNGGSVPLEAPTGSQYNVVWLQNGSPIPGATDSTYLATSSGSYQVVFSNTSNCPDTSTAEVVTVLSPLVVNAGNLQVLCFEDDSLRLGNIPLANGSLGPYNYAWTGSNLGSVTVANPMAAPVSNSTYTVMVTDAAGCQNSGTIMVNVNPALVASAGVDTILCMGTPVVLGGMPSGAGGSGNLSYQWTPSFGLNNPNLPNPVANSNALGAYVLQITDANGCQLQDTMEVIRHPALFADAGADTVLCGAGTVSLGGITPASGGDGPYNVIWSPSAGLSNPATGNPVATVTVTTTYDLQVTDLNGCIANDQVTVQVEPAAVAGFGFSTNLGTVTFVSSAQQANSVLWLFGDNNSSTIINPTHTYQNSGVYDVCQVATNTCGTDTFCQQVNVTVIGVEDGLAGDFKIYPNPHSGTFWLEMKSLEAESMTIRNAFGQIVFREWGSWSAGSRTQIQVSDLPSGVYYFELEGTEGKWTRRMVIMK